MRKTCDGFRRQQSEALHPTASPMATSPRRRLHCGLTRNSTTSVDANAAVAAFRTPRLYRGS